MSDTVPSHRRHWLPRPLAVAFGSIALVAGTIAFGSSVTGSSGAVVQTPGPVTERRVIFAAFEVAVWGFPVYGESSESGGRPAEIADRGSRVRWLILGLAPVAGLINAIVIGWVVNRLCGAFSRPEDPDDASP